RLVVGRRGFAESALVAPGIGEVAPDQLRDRGCARAHLTRIEERPQALRPEAVVGAVPAEPALEARVHQALRVAIDFLEAPAARPPVLPVPAGHVAARAGDGARSREARIVEEPLAERDRVHVPRDPVARVADALRRPRAW